LPWVKLVNTKMSSTAVESGRSPKFLRDEIRLESFGDLFCGSDGSCLSIGVDTYFRCDIERRCAVEEAYLERKADSWRHGPIAAICVALSASERKVRGTIAARVEARTFLAEAGSRM
jgi:hypothetical protein